MTAGEATLCSRWGFGVRGGSADLAGALRRRNGGEAGSGAPVSCVAAGGGAGLA